MMARIKRGIEWALAVFVLSVVFGGAMVGIATAVHFMDARFGWLAGCLSLVGVISIAAGIAAAIYPEFKAGGE